MSKRNRNSEGGIVFSTNPNFKPVDQHDGAIETLPMVRQKLNVRLDTKQRRGKTVTIVSGFVGGHEELGLLAKQLKNHCGSGGSSKDGEILIQGDFREKILSFLNRMG